jgi:hypothetical protein
MSNSIRNSTQGSQIIAALEVWNQVNQQLGVPVHLILRRIPGLFRADQSHPCLEHNHCTMRKERRSLDYRTDRSQPVRYLHQYTLRCNRLLQPGGALEDPLNPGTSGPYFDQNLEGYDSIFKKVMEHETGHNLGLGHVASENCEQNGASVMNRAIAPVS